MPAIELLIPR